MTSPSTSTLRVGIAGLGAIGWKVATALATGMDGLTLVAVAGRDGAKTATQAAALPGTPRAVTPAELPALADIVVDCAPSAAFAALAHASVAAGRVFMSVNAGALLANLDLVDKARASGARVIVPTGALLGLDAVRAAAEGTIERVVMITRKPPNGLEGAPYLVERGITLAGLAEARMIFDGTATEGARGFPANVNVAAALGLAGIGPDRTRLQIWADPAVDRNIHTIEVEADSARFKLQIENVPSEENPRTGKITALSVIACLRSLTAPLRVGT